MDRASKLFSIKSRLLIKMNYYLPLWIFIEKPSILVGGGSLLSPGGAAAGSPQALALALVPAGLTPVAFFPPNPNQKNLDVKTPIRAFHSPFRSPIKVKPLSKVGGPHGSISVSVESPNSGQGLKSDSKNIKFSGDKKNISEIRKNS